MCKLKNQAAKLAGQSYTYTIKNSKKQASKSHKNMIVWSSKNKKMPEAVSILYFLLMPLAAYRMLHR